MTGDPERIVEVQIVEGAVHHAFNGLYLEITSVQKKADGEKKQGEIRQNRTPQKGGFGKPELCAESLLNGGIDDKMRRNGIQEFPSLAKVSSSFSTDGLSVGSWLGWTRRRIRF